VHRSYLIAGETQIGLMELSKLAPVYQKTSLREFFFSMRLQRVV
jgi:hypothetical protein